MERSVPIEVQRSILTIGQLLLGAMECPVCSKKIDEAETACNARQLAEMVLKLTKSRKSREEQK